MKPLTKQPLIKLVVDDAEAASLLSISPEDLDQLAVTGQLDPIQFRGRRLFLIDEIQELATRYKTAPPNGIISDESKHSQQPAPDSGPATVPVQQVAK